MNNKTERKRFDYIDQMFLLDKLRDKQGNLLPANLEIMHSELPGLEELIKNAGEKDISVSGERNGIF